MAVVPSQERRRGKHGQGCGASPPHLLVRKPSWQWQILQKEPRPDCPGEQPAGTSLNYKCFLTFSIQLCSSCSTFVASFRFACFSLDTCCSERVFTDRIIPVEQFTADSFYNVKQPLAGGWQYTGSVLKLNMFLSSSASVLFKPPFPSAFLNEESFKSAPPTPGFRCQHCWEVQPAHGAELISQTATQVLNLNCPLAEPGGM